MFSGRMMDQRQQHSSCLGLTAGAAAIAFLFYPMTIAPTGNLSNGGVLGFGSLVVASVLAWRAFTLSKSPWLRRLVQLPLTALISYMAIKDALCQCCSHWWWGL